MEGVAQLIDRYAPSPTSDLHVGNLRTALAGWLLARAAGGRWLLRVEDLDTARVKAANGAADRQLSDLVELGLGWDGEVMVQSQRLASYRAALDVLADQTYECFCTRKEIAAAASAPHGDEFRPYPGTCSRLDEQSKSELRKTRWPAIRVRAEAAQFSVTDINLGEISAEVDDFVLVRSDGTFGYNFAVVVDDMAQHVTQITRGADLASSAPRQAWLTAQLGGTPARYAHIGLVSDERGNRLAKRDGSITLAGLHHLGMTTPQVVAMMAESLGLPPIDSPDEALAEFKSSGPSTRFWQATRWNPRLQALVPQPSNQP